MFGDCCTSENSGVGRRLEVGRSSSSRATRAASLRRGELVLRRPEKCQLSLVLPDTAERILRACARIPPRPQSPDSSSSPSSPSASSPNRSASAPSPISASSASSPASEFVSRLGRPAASIASRPGSSLSEPSPNLADRGSLPGGARRRLAGRLRRPSRGLLRTPRSAHASERFRRGPARRIG